MRLETPKDGPFSSGCVRGSRFVQQSSKRTLSPRCGMRALAAFVGSPGMPGWRPACRDGIPARASMCAHGAASAQRTGRGRSEGGGVGADQAGRAARLRSLGRAVLVGAVVLATSCGGGTASWAAEEDAMQPQFYLQQVQDAMPLKTMRGVWRYKEQREGQVSLCPSRLPPHAAGLPQPRDC